jgi:photosystem II stability/assembly factor-like uncharacterized protein
MTHRKVPAFALVLLFTAALTGQVRDSSPKVETVLKGIEYRSLGFSRGGRSTAVTGVPGKPLVYYFGSTGGGVWKSVDGGNAWANVSDGFFEAGSIGAVAVAESDANVVYAGTGSACPRGNISSGVGVYRSTDAGKTWKHAGLRESGQIGRIRVHPKDANLLYVAALGHIFGPNDERGVFRSRDGGKTWEKVLFASSKTGAVDLSMDPNNPRVLYAALWTTERKPWTILSGSAESGLYKTTDGGDTWTKLKGGLPEGVVGKIGVSVSPANPERVWAIVEAPDTTGGIYRSDNAGETWRKVNGERRFLQRAWYYIHIYADPKSPETVYVLNTGFYRSTDGGRTYQSISTPHGDNHDLWINPTDPGVMINANDGGANVSFTGGTSWSTQMNQPTAEFYRVAVDTQFPYRVYGAQQDNSTASVPSRSDSREDMAFYSVGGGEAGHVAVDPRNANIVYAGNYGGTLTRLDTATRLMRSVKVYPESSTGQRALDMKYRFQWNAPIRISPHEPDTVYTTSQVVHRTRDAGHSWQVVSPDLTRADKSKLDFSGGPISRDNTGVEVYGTIFAFEESPHARGLLWAGSDDGLVHVSRDNGANWKNVTPAAMPEFATVNMIDPSRRDPARALIAVHRYRQDDYKPYIFRTTNYGASWDLLTDGRNGIPAGHFVRVVREDPDRPGLLYAGTEFGMYVSFDDGAHWEKFQLNLPITPITDLAVYRHDLLVATQGRAFWVLDDLTPLNRLSDVLAKSSPALLPPRPAYRAPGFTAGVYYYLPQETKETLTLEVLDSSGKVVQIFSSKAEEPAVREGGAGEEEESPFRRAAGDRRLTTRAGMNRFRWGLTAAPLFRVPPRIVMWGGGGATGPAVVPGSYQVRLKLGSWSQTEKLEVLKDPRLAATQAELQEQFDLAVRVGTQVKEIYDSILRIRDVRKQATELGERLEKAGLGDDAKKAAKALSDKLTRVEGDLTQLQGEGGQDALNFPGRLDNQFVALYSEVAASTGRPSAGAIARLADLKPELARLMSQLKEVFDRDLASFNQVVKSKNAPPVIVGAEKTAAPASQ